MYSAGQAVQHGACQPLRAAHFGPVLPENAIRTGISRLIGLIVSSGGRIDV